MTEIIIKKRKLQPNEFDYSPISTFSFTTLKELFDHIDRYSNLKIIDIAKKVAKIIPSEIVINKNNNDPRSYRQNSSKLLSTGFKNKFSVCDAIREIKEKYEDNKFTESDKCYTVKWMKTIDLQLKSI